MERKARKGGAGAKPPALSRSGALGLVAGGTRFPAAAPGVPRLTPGIQARMNRQATVLAAERRLHRRDFGGPHDRA